MKRETKCVACQNDQNYQVMNPVSNCDFKVFLTFEDADRIYGTFNAMFKQNIYMFEFCPDDSEPFSPDTINIEHVPVFFFLHKLTSLAITNNPDGDIAIKFLFTQKRAFVRFVFSKSESDKLDALIQTLLARNLITLKSPGYYNVIAECKRSYSVPQGRINLNRLQYLYIYRQEIQKLKKPITEEIPLTKEELLEHFEPDGSVPNDTKLKALINQRGLTPEARFFIYPYLMQYRLFNLSNEANEKRILELNNTYQKLLNVWLARVPQQIVKSNHFFGVIRADVIRTDRNRPMFEKDESPAISFLEEVLICSVIGNHDHNYTQGMNDIAAEIMQLFFKEIRDDKSAVTFDDKVLNQIEAESMIFWCLQGFLDVTGHGIFFSKMNEIKDIFMHRSYAIIKYNMPTVAKWLADSSLDSLVYAIRPTCILFRRDLKEFFKVWDFLLTDPDPPIFLRFFVAAVVILAFPELSAAQSDDMGGIVTLFDEGLSHRSVPLLLDLSKTMRLHTLADHTGTSWIFMHITEDHELTDFKPSMFSLI